MTPVSSGFKRRRSFISQHACSLMPYLSLIHIWTVEDIHDTLLALPEQLEVKNGTLLWPVRIAAAGMTVTPGGAIEILAILGKEETLRRLNIGLEKLKAENKE